MNEKNSDQPARHIAWVHPAELDSVLSAATYLESTRELRELGWQVTLIAPGPSGKRDIRGVEVLNLSRPDRYFLRQLVFHMKTVWVLISLWSKLDIILFREISTPWILPLRVARDFTRRQRPLFVMDTRSVHMPPRERQSVNHRLRGHFIDLMVRLANHWADGRTAITPRMADTLKIPTHRLWGLWPSGVNLETFAPARQIRQWPVGDEPIQLIYIGSMEYERNLMNLCQAVAQANDKQLAFKLSLVGDGPERQELEDFAEQAPCSVRVLRSVPHEMVPELLAHAHVGVLPFPDEEKFQVSSPIKLFEYLAAGLPVLATRIDCHTDVIKDAGCVFWAESADIDGLIAALHRVQRAKPSLMEMERLAADAADEWTWRKSAEKLKLALEYGLSERHDKPSWMFAGNNSQN